MCDKCVADGKISAEELAEAEAYQKTFSKSILKAIFAHPEPANRTQTGMILSFLMRMVIGVYRSLTDEQDPTKFLEFAMQAYGKEVFGKEIEVVNMGNFNPTDSKKEIKAN